MTKLDEMIEAFQVAVTAAKSGFASGPSDEDLREGMRAVLRKHIEPMIADELDARDELVLECAAHNDQCECEAPKAAAARIIATLTEQAE